MRVTKKRLIVVGAGGFGRELFSWAADCHQAGSLPPLAGFIDDNPTQLETYGYDLPCLGGIDDFRPSPQDSLLIAIGAPATKKRVTEQLRDRGAKFATMLHPSAVIARTAHIGEGAIFCPLSLASADARIGRLVIVNTLSSVGHDVTLGDYCTLSAHVDLTGSTALGEGVLVGSGAKLLPKVRIGDWATIGAGSTVYRSVPAGATVYSAPAKLMGRNKASSPAASD
jgi:sugar O-acyltransferase (sialic acid O-acetyltransferase NeuD family)